MYPWVAGSLVGRAVTARNGCAVLPFPSNRASVAEHIGASRVFRPKCRSRSKQRTTISAMRQLYFLWQGRALRSRLIRARAWLILSVAVYLLLFAWNILNVRFV